MAGAVLCHPPGPYTACRTTDTRSSGHLDRSARRVCRASSARPPRRGSDVARLSTSERSDHNVPHYAPGFAINKYLCPTGRIHIWETQGNIATGVEQSRGDRREATLSPDRKRRRDHTVREAPLVRHLASTIGRRVMPEVFKAFAFRATRFEGFTIACYDAATGGVFRAHRDNLSPATAHRRFALSLNLNAGYEGGYLRFPEYGPHLYRPAAGGALVFACSHLHEVTEVRQGRRFVLLSFLFNEGESRPVRARSTESAPLLPPSSR